MTSVIFTREFIPTSDASHRSLTMLRWRLDGGSEPKQATTYTYIRIPFTYHIQPCLLFVFRVQLLACAHFHFLPENTSHFPNLLALQLQFHEFDLQPRQHCTFFRHQQCQSLQALLIILFLSMCDYRQGYISKSFSTNVSQFPNQHAFC